MQDLEDKIEELESQVAKLTNFCEVAAIGSEQLWEVVFEDILKQPVPSGENLRNLI